MLVVVDGVMACGGTGMIILDSDCHWWQAKVDWRAYDNMMGPIMGARAYMYSKDSPGIADLDCRSQTSPSADEFIIAATTTCTALKWYE